MGIRTSYNAAMQRRLAATGQPEEHQHVKTHEILAGGASLVGEPVHVAEEDAEETLQRIYGDLDVDLVELLTLAQLLTDGTAEAIAGGLPYGQTMMDHVCLAVLTGILHGRELGRREAESR